MYAIFFILNKCCDSSIIILRVLRIYSKDLHLVIGWMNRTSVYFSILVIVFEVINAMLKGDNINNVKSVICHISCKDCNGFLKQIANIVIWPIFIMSYPICKHKIWSCDMTFQKIWSWFMLTVVYFCRSIEKSTYSLF